MAAFGGGVPVFTGGNKRGQDIAWFPVPFDSLIFFALTHRRCSETGGYGGTIPGCVGQIWGRAVMPLNLLCRRVAAHNSARPDGAGRRRSAAKSSASINRASGAPNACGPPSLRTRDRRELRPQEGFGVTRGGGNHTVPLPFCPRRETLATPPPGGGYARPGGHRQPSPAQAASRRNSGRLYRRQTVNIKAFVEFINAL